MAITTARRPDNIPLIFTGAGPIHPVHSQPMSLATKAMPRNEVTFLPFSRVLATAPLCGCFPASLSPGKGNHVLQNLLHAIHGRANTPCHPHRCNLQIIQALTCAETCFRHIGLCHPNLVELRSQIKPTESFSSFQLRCTIFEQWKARQNFSGDTIDSSKIAYCPQAASIWLWHKKKRCTIRR